MKIKNSEGFDRIPQRIIKDGLENLIEPFTQLFERVYIQRTVPEQWLLAKTIPIHKKGPKKIWKITDQSRIYAQSQKFLKN